MKITRVRDAVAPIPSPMRNAVISFDKMTISVVAVETDVVREGKPVIGYGFTSNGRYAQSGIIRERLAPRILEADPAKLRDEAAGTLDPDAVWAAMMSNEKPGGHGDRAFAAGAIDMAVWDATAKILGKPLWRVLSERYNGGRFDERVLVYSGGGYYYPGKEKQGLQDEMRQCRDLGYRLMKMKIGGASLAEDMQRIEWALEVAGAGEHLAVDANGRFDLDTALAYAQAMERYGLGWFEEPVEPLDYRAHAVLCDATDIPIATGENLFSVPGFPQPRAPWRHAPAQGLAAARPLALLRPHRVPSHSCHGRSRRLVAAALRARTAGTSSASTWRLGCSSAAPRAIPACSSPTAVSPTRSRSSTATPAHTRRRASAWSCEPEMFADMRKRLEFD